MAESSFDYSTATAALQAANQALATAAPAIGNRRQMARAFKYQQQAMQQQSQLWRENTEWLTDFNSPSNQLARYRAAGINPNFVFGNVSAAAQNGQNPTAQAPDITRQQAQFAQALSGISDVVPLFQQAMKSQQELQRGEIAQAMDIERLKAMQVNNRYQEEFLDTRNRNAAYDYAYKVGTESQRKKLSYYQAENAERAYYDAIDASDERKKTWNLRYGILQQQYDALVKDNKFVDEYGFSPKQLGPIGSFLFNLFGLNKGNPLKDGITTVGEKIPEYIKEAFPETDKKHTEYTNKVVKDTYQRLRDRGYSHEKAMKLMRRRAGIW